MARAARLRAGMRVGHAPEASGIVRFAARELAAALGAMLSEAVRVEAVSGLDAHRLLLAPAGAAALGAGAPAAMPAPSSLGSARERAAPNDDGFAVQRMAASAGAAGAGGRGHPLVVAGASARAVLHGAYDLLERLGARFALGRAPALPRVERAQLDALAPYGVTPAFSRRAFVSDIMTWHYEDPARLRTHVAHDREFCAWMGHWSINAFEYIRHAQDTQLKIDEVAPMLARRGIEPEYGGHVLPLLLAREQFAAHPEYFPCGDDGQRNASGNLCVSSSAALELVRAGAVGMVRRNPEMAMLHIWGADVRGGAWCRCGGCAALSPQLQYMRVVNEVAAALAGEGAAAPPVAYLAYHDTLEPDPALRPLENVWFEWAPRERCYRHAIDDPACMVNPRYRASLERYLDLFDGRGHVFEYYADAILFGGMGFAMPSTIVRDLKAYHRMGLRSISCLTFGAFSALAYPVNLETFARATRSLDIDSGAALDETAAARHPGCGAAMARAYSAVARGSALALTYGDVMLAPAEPARAAERRARLLEAAAQMRIGVAAAQGIASGAAARAALAAKRGLEVGAERDLWEYSVETLEGLGEWLLARTLAGAERRAAGARAIEKVGCAIRHVREIDSARKGTWGTYDLERLHEIWIEKLKRRLDS